MLNNLRLHVDTTATTKNSESIEESDMEMFELNKNTMLNNNKTSSRRTSASMGMVPTTKDLILIVVVALLITAGKYERYNDQGLLKVGAYLENCWSTLYILCILQECHATAPGNLSMKNFLKNLCRMLLLCHLQKHKSLFLSW